MEEEYDELGFDDVLGNEEAINTLRIYANNIDRGVKCRPILISGPAGTGKSMAVHLLASEHRWNVVEMNASDYRDKGSIDRLLLTASQSRTVFGKKNLILLDEIDELAAKFDTGAGSAITNIINTSRSPVVLVANDRWRQNIAFLRETVDYVDFKKLPSDVIYHILEKYVKKHGLKVDRATIDIVANRSKGDARSAINDVIVLDGAENGAVDVIGLRDKKIEIFEALDKIFFSNTFSAPLAASSGLDTKKDSAEMLIKWIDENIPKRYAEPADRAMAYEMLSQATIFATRAARSQYFIYWRYMNALMSSGVALSKTAYPDTRQRYTFPKLIKELSRTKGKRNADTEIALTLQRNIHSDIARIKDNEMRIIAKMAFSMFENGEKVRDDVRYDFFISRLGLGKEEVDWLVESVKAEHQAQ